MSDLIDRRAAIDDLHGKDPSQIWDTADVEVWINELPSVQPDHTADIGKKVSISCGRENDAIFREAAIEALARMMPRSYTPDGSHPADEEIFRVQEVFADCIEALEILPSAQPEPHEGHWIGGDGSYICSECNGSPMDFINTMGASFDAYVETPMNFCPNCGADMRGGDSNE